MPQEHRDFYPIFNKNAKYSENLKTEVVSGLAILTNNTNLYTNCPQDTIEEIKYMFINDLFSNSDWRTFASINNLLPTIAEISPPHFLEKIEEILVSKKKVFLDIFSEESCNVFGSNYLTGTLWAMEVLAWESKFFARVCLILAEISDIDPGGNWQIDLLILL